MASDRVMTLKQSNNPDYWRNRAEEARGIAVQMVDPQTKATMLAIARDYEKLAKRAEQRASERRLGSDPHAASRRDGSSPSADDGGGNLVG